MTTKATVRMYNQQDLGDCFLLTFTHGNKESHLWIDFGSFSGNKDREGVIAQNIIETLKDNPVYIAATHQHKDHLSGFGTQKKLLTQLKVQQVWLSFLDDMNSKTGEVIRNSVKDYEEWSKAFKSGLEKRSTLNNNPKVKDMMEAKTAWDTFGETQSNKAGLLALYELSDKKMKYLSPGQVFGMPGLEDKVRIYVLGPPSDLEALNSLDPNHKKNEDVQGLAFANSYLNLKASYEGILDAFKEPKEDNFPFNAGYGFHKTETPNPDLKPAQVKIYNLYSDEAAKVRQIEDEWLAEAGRLSLHMGDLTNNSSLVLAFELIDSGKVLLFPGDAQIGNWKSWFDVKFENSTKTTKELLQRTVFYKAGHHSSHNATYGPALDLMNEEELLIMIPVNIKESEKKKFDMVFPAMIHGYGRKANGRVLRNDTIWQDEKDVSQKPKAQNWVKQPFSPPFINKSSKKPKFSVFPAESRPGDHLYIEYTVE